MTEVQKKIDSINKRFNKAKNNFIRKGQEFDKIVKNTKTILKRK